MGQKRGGTDMGSRVWISSSPACRYLSLSGRTSFSSSQFFGITMFHGKKGRLYNFQMDKTDLTDFAGLRLLSSTAKLSASNPQMPWSSLAVTER